MEMKSLLLRLLHGLIPPEAGSILWASGAYDSRQGPHPRQAMVFQRPVLLRRSVAANVDYALALRGVSRAERRRSTAPGIANWAAPRPSTK